jgi:hypothetical protein
MIVGKIDYQIPFFDKRYSPTSLKKNISFTRQADLIERSAVL